MGNITGVLTICASCLGNQKLINFRRKQVFIENNVVSLIVLCFDCSKGQLFLFEFFVHKPLT